MDPFTFALSIIFLLAAVCAFIISKMTWDDRHYIASLFNLIVGIVCLFYDGMLTGVL